MRILTILVFALIVVPQELLGGDPPIFVLRGASDLRQGIVRMDPQTGVESPFASFIHQAVRSVAFGGLELTATADRIIAQGAAYYEFDATSGQLLRRYLALSPPYQTWAFHGTAVDPAMAEKLGIPPGYYGAPVCPPGPGPTGLGCGGPDELFPGYTERSNLTYQHVFLRRGFEPGDTSLTLVKLFSPGATGGYWGARSPAIDPERRQFWFWLRGDVVERLSAAPIAAGAIGDEHFVRDEPRPSKNFAFDAGRDSFFLSFFGPYFEGPGRLTRLATNGAEETVKIAPEGSSFYSVTSLPLIEPRTYTQLLPAIGDAPGQNGTYWRTDAWLFNPSDALMEVTLRRVSKPDVATRVALAAKSSAKLSNVLGQLGGGPAGDGTTTDALVIESPFRSGAQVSVYSRTYTPSPSGGSYGQAVPAVPSLAGYTNHFDGVGGSAAISDTDSVFILDKRNPEQFRHNIGIVNPSDAPITLRLRYAIVSYLPVNDPDLQKFVTVAPHSVRQVSIEALFPKEVLETLPPFIMVAGDRPAALWLSMVDNKTGDASFIPFTQYDVEAGAESWLAFPSVIHAPGANGTFWRTDAYGQFSHRVRGGPAQSPAARFHPAPDNCQASFNLTPSAGKPSLTDAFWFTMFTDLARQACPSASSVRGAMEVSTGSWMSAVSRTYTTREDGGTYGDILPLYPPRGWRSRHFAGIEVSDFFRVNVGLYNGAEISAQTELRLYHSDGTLVATTVNELASHASVQMPLAQLFGKDLEDGLYALSVIPLGEAGTWPYVSTVDNITGDPTNWW